MFDIVLAFVPVVSLAIAACVRYGVVHVKRRPMPTRFVVNGFVRTVADFQNAQLKTIVRK